MEHDAEPRRAGNARDIFINNSRDINNVGLVQRFPYLQMIFCEQGCPLHESECQQAQEGSGKQRQKVVEQASVSALGRHRGCTAISDSASLAGATGVGCLAGSWVT